MEVMSFEKIYGINVSEKIEKKGNLAYLSWTWAWAEFKKIFPKATYKVDAFGGTYCTGNEKLGYMVRTEVTADELTYEMWLPIMDSRNQTILQPKMTEVNKSIMRCLTKNLAMFGLGLYIYAGEDLPEGDDGEGTGKPTPKTAPKTQAAPKTEQRPNKRDFCAKYGILDYEKCIDAYERRLGGSRYEEWTIEEIEAVEEDLARVKAKRDQERRMRETEGEFPFDIGG
jgi:hypothetical protein